jgi:hypothetical protein
MRALINQGFRLINALGRSCATQLWCTKAA